MKISKKIISLLIVLCLVITAFAGCGKKNTDDGKDTGKTEAKAAKVIDIELTDEEYAFGVDKSQPELLKAVNEFIAEIKANGKFDEICNNNFGDGEPVAVVSAKEDSKKDQLVVATNAAFEPFESTKGDKFYGIDMEIAALLAQKLGKELVIKNMEFDSVCLSVGQQKCDIAMAGLTINDKRKESVTFSDPYYKASQKIIVRGDDTAFDKCKSKADVEKILNGLDSKTKIGYQTGTTGNSYVKGSEDFGFKGLKATGKGYKSGSLAVQDMINGNINYVIIDSAPATSIVTAINEVA